MQFFAEEFKDIICKSTEKTLLKIFEIGAVGTINDFYRWMKMYCQLAALANQEIPGCLQKLTESDVRENIELLQKKKLIADTGKGFNEFGYLKQFPGFLKGEKTAYSLIGNLEFSPLQLVRSRLESFLVHFQANREDLTDLSIGVIEAAENAVKYGDNGQISIEYTLSDTNTFHIEITNPIKIEPVEENIKTGKFSEGFTLMRGIMAINKLFDHFDITRNDELKYVKFIARKKLDL